MSEKNITVNGKNNIYKINKMIYEKCNVKKEKSEMIDIIYYNINEQINLITDKTSEIYKNVSEEIKQKLSSYKQQDKNKNRYDVNMFISYDDVIELLQSTSCKCYYCNNIMCILYEYKNEKKQWTLDRINNDLGHNTNNVVCSCLGCNIQKRKRDHDKFLFTKKLVIDKI